MLIRDLKKVFIDINTKQRINQHILNQHDIITDDDIKNINTNLDELRISRLSLNSSLQNSKQRIAGA